MSLFFYYLKLVFKPIIFYIIFYLLFLLFLIKQAQTWLGLCPYVSDWSHFARSCVHTLRSILRSVAKWFRYDKNSEAKSLRYDFFVVWTPQSDTFGCDVEVDTLQNLNHSNRSFVFQHQWLQLFESKQFIFLC